MIEEEEEIRASAAAFFQNLLSSDVESLLEPNSEDFAHLPDSVDLGGLCAIS